MTDSDESFSVVATTAPGDNAPALSVSELSTALKRTVEGAFDHVRVRGEISGFKRHGSGHCYFTLKDDSACIDAVIWRGQAGALRFAPEDGLEVVATGRLTTYPARSRYQIVVERLELAGQGALMALLDRRRQALAAEGRTAGGDLGSVELGSVALRSIPLRAWLMLHGLLRLRSAGVRVPVCSLQDRLPASP